MTVTSLSLWSYSAFRLNVLIILSSNSLVRRRLNEDQIWCERGLWVTTIKLIQYLLTVKHITDVVRKQTNLISKVKTFQTKWLCQIATINHVQTRKTFNRQPRYSYLMDEYNSITQEWEKAKQINCSDLASSSQIVECPNLPAKNCLRSKTMMMMMMRKEQ